MGVSGGKDNLCLLHALVADRRRAPFPYELTEATIEQGKFGSARPHSAHYATFLRRQGYAWRSHV